MRLDQGTCLFLAAFLAPAADEAPVLVSAPGASDDDEDEPSAAAREAALDAGGAPQLVPAVPWQMWCGSVQRLHMCKDFITNKAVAAASTPTQCPLDRQGCVLPTCWVEAVGEWIRQVCNAVPQTPSSERRRRVAGDRCCWTTSHASEAMSRYAQPEQYAQL